MGKISYVGRSLMPAEYIALREAVGWTPVDFTQAALATRMDLFSVVVLTESSEAIGCCRVLGDGVLYFYIQDLIVVPKFQRRGVGTKIMEIVFSWLGAKASSQAFAGLMAAPGTAAFFTRFGFVPRPEGGPGMQLAEMSRLRSGQA